MAAQQPARDAAAAPAAAPVGGAVGGSSSEGDAGNVKVAVRCRPPVSHELLAGFTSCVSVTAGTNIVLTDFETATERPFAFDAAFGSDSKQVDVYNAFGPQMVAHATKGYNISILAYGQTGSGKSFSMHGQTRGAADGSLPANAGFIPRLCSDLFQAVRGIKGQEGEECVHRVEAAYFQLYCERVTDLLAVDGTLTQGRSGGAGGGGGMDLDSNSAAGSSRLRVREHPDTGPFIEGLSWHAVDGYAAIERLITDGNLVRAVAATNMNATSSRSHAIVTLRYTQTRIDKLTNSVSDTTSKISLIDLAGSERVGKTGAEGQRLKEAGSINKSLSSLGLVIAALAARSDGGAAGSAAVAAAAHVPYRDSILTWLLKDSLGGNAKTLMIATISPAESNYEESLSTLRYADRAKRIKNQAVVNEDANAALIRQLREELLAVKAQLEELRASTMSPQEKVVFVDNPELVAEVESLRVQTAFQDRMLKQINNEWDARLKATAEGATARHEALRGMGIAGAGIAGEGTADDNDDAASTGSSFVQGGGQLGGVEEEDEDWTDGWEGQLTEDAEAAMSVVQLAKVAEAQTASAQRPLPPQRPYLVLLHTDDMLNRTLTCPLRDGDTRIGSASDNDIHLQGAGLGAHHCVVSHFSQSATAASPAVKRLTLYVEAGCRVYVNGAQVEAPALTRGGTDSSDEDDSAGRDAEVGDGKQLQHGDRLLLGDDRHVFMLIDPAAPRDAAWDGLQQLTWLDAVNELTSSLVEYEEEDMWGDDEFGGQLDEVDQLAQAEAEVPPDEANLGMLRGQQQVTPRSARVIDGIDDMHALPFDTKSPLRARTSSVISAADTAAASSIAATVAQPEYDIDVSVAEIMEAMRSATPATPVHAAADVTSNNIESAEQALALAEALLQDWPAAAAAEDAADVDVTSAAPAAAALPAMPALGMAALLMGRRGHDAGSVTPRSPTTIEAALSHREMNVSPIETASPADMQASGDDSIAYAENERAQGVGAAATTPPPEVSSSTSEPMVSTITATPPAIPVTPTTVASRPSDAAASASPAPQPRDVVSIPALPLPSQSVAATTPPQAPVASSEHDTVVLPAVADGSEGSAQVADDESVDTNGTGSDDVAPMAMSSRLHKHRYSVTSDTMLVQAPRAPPGILARNRTPRSPSIDSDLSAALATIRRRHAKRFEALLLTWAERSFMDAVHAPLTTLAAWTAEANALARAMGSRYRFSRRALWIASQPSSTAASSSDGPTAAWASASRTQPPVHLLTEAMVAAPAAFALGASLWRLPADGDVSAALPCGLCSVSAMRRHLVALRFMYQLMLEGKSEVALRATAGKLPADVAAVVVSDRGAVPTADILRDAMTIFLNERISPALAARAIVSTAGLLPPPVRSTLGPHGAFSHVMVAPLTSAWGDTCGYMHVALLWMAEMTAPQLHVLRVQLGGTQPPVDFSTLPLPPPASLAERCVRITFEWQAVIPAIVAADEAVELPPWYEGMAGASSMILMEQGDGLYSSRAENTVTAVMQARHDAHTRELSLVANEVLLLAAGGVAITMRALVPFDEEEANDRFTEAGVTRSGATLPAARVATITPNILQRNAELHIGPSNSGQPFLADTAADAQAELTRMQLNVVMDLLQVDTAAPHAETTAAGQRHYIPTGMSRKARDTGSTAASASSGGLFSSFAAALKLHAHTGDGASMEPTFTVTVDTDEPAAAAASASSRMLLRLPSMRGRDDATRRPGAPGASVRLVASVQQFQDGTPFALESVAHIRVTDLRYLPVKPQAGDLPVDLPFEPSISCAPTEADADLPLSQHRDPSGRCLRLICDLQPAQLLARRAGTLRALGYCLQHATGSGFRVYIRVQVSLNVRGALAPIAFARWLPFKVKALRGSVAAGVGRTLRHIMSGVKSEHALATAHDARRSAAGPVDAAVSPYMWYEALPWAIAVERVHALSRRCVVAVSHAWPHAASEGAPGKPDANDIDTVASEMSQLGLRHATGILRARTPSMLPSTLQTSSAAGGAPAAATSTSLPVQDVHDLIMPPLASSVRLPRCEHVDVQRGAYDRSGYLLKKQAHAGRWLRRWYVLSLPFMATYHTAAQADGGDAPKAVVHVHGAIISDERGVLVLRHDARGQAHVGVAAPGEAASAAGGPRAGGSSRSILPAPAKGGVNAAASPRAAAAAPASLFFDVTVAFMDSDAQHGDEDGDGDAHTGDKAGGVVWRLQANNAEEKDAWVLAILQAAAVTHNACLY